jgi:hypothetical protein
MSRAGKRKESSRVVAQQYGSVRVRYDEVSWVGKNDSHTRVGGTTFMSNAAELREIDDVGADCGLVERRSSTKRVLRDWKQFVKKKNWCNIYAGRGHSHALTFYAKATRDERSHHSDTRRLVHKSDTRLVGLR